MTDADVALLRCLRCHGRLAFEGSSGDGHLDEGRLTCRSCARWWRVRRGLPHLYDGPSVGLQDRFMRLVYDGIAPFHDLGARFGLPLAQFSSSQTGREEFVRRLELGSLTPSRIGEPVRILEIGIGAGANVPFIQHALPPGVDAEVWGLDLSLGMLAIARARTWWYGWSTVRLLAADAHTLPFPDTSFDRVFHVGGIATYSDARQALAEMARVARPETPILVVDEQLDPKAGRSLYFRLGFWALTWYDRDPHAPVELLPESAVDVRVEQVSRFYYGLTFRTAGPRETRRTSVT